MPDRKTHFSTTRVGTLLAAFFAVTPALFAATLLLDVPLVHQQRNGCGPASLQMIEAYWNANRALRPPSAPAQSAASLPATPEGGTSLADMRRYLDANGYHAFTMQASMADLQQQIAKGRALIVTLEMKRGTGKGLHYVVVTGFDEKKIFVNDPAKRKPGSVERAKFEAAWNHAGRWILLGVPRSEPNQAANKVDSGSGRGLGSR